MNTDRIKLVVVTGAGSGIGRATSLRFAREGATIIASDIDAARATETAALIERDGGRAYGYRLDVTDVPAFEAFAAQVKAEHGVPDVIVGNAGIATVGGVLEHSADDWDRVIDVNLMGVVHGARLFGAQMIERGRGGHIVNMASLAAFTPTGQGAPYSMTKAAVRMLSESLRGELAPHRIGVSAICPGGINTAIWTDSLHVAADPEVAARRSSAAGRWVRRLTRAGLFSPPEHVARVVVRAVRYNWAIVPVRPEAWFMFALSRLAPGLARGIGRATTGRQALALADKSPLA